MGVFNICDVFDHLWLLGRKRAEAVKVAVLIAILLFPPLGVYIVRQAVQRAQLNGIAVGKLLLKPTLITISHLSTPPSDPLLKAPPAPVADPRFPPPITLQYPDKK